MKEMDWGFNLVDFGNGLLVIIGGVVGALGLRKGFKGSDGTKPAQVVTEVAGALVDASSVQKLTDAIVHYTNETMHTRKCLHTLNENLEDIAEQTKEIRNALHRHGDILLSRK